MKAIVFFMFIILLSKSVIFAQSPDNNIEIGSRAPEFTVYDANGEAYNSKEILNESSIVLIFYRGDWCPVCTRYLSNLQDSLSFIQNKNAVVLAVSPDKPQNLDSMKAKTGAEFILVQDKDYGTMKSFDVAFNPDKKSKDMYNERLKANLDAGNLLPVPATFVIDQSGTVVYKHYNPDYKKRATVKQIMDHLPAQIKYDKD